MFPIVNMPDLRDAG